MLSAAFFCNNSWGGDVRIYRENITQMQNEHCDSKMKSLKINKSDKAVHRKRTLDEDMDFGNHGNKGRESPLPNFRLDEKR